MVRFASSLATALLLGAGTPWARRAATYGEAGELDRDTSVDAAVKTNTTAPVKSYPQALQDKFALKRKLACGFHGCAFLATRQTDKQDVVVKVSDPTSDPLEAECGEMRWMRYESCKRGKDILSLHESYLPSCEEFGKVGRFQYLVMPMAGPLAIKKWHEGHDLTVEQQKGLTAQLVAGLYALSAVGLWHNDLNGGNLMIDGNHLSLIDFGQLKQVGCKTRLCMQGYARDMNALVRWMSVLANCPQNARFKLVWWFKTEPVALKKYQNRVLQCIKTKWNPDDQFVTALQHIFKENIKITTTQSIEPLFKSPFIQSNLKPADSRYRLAGTEGCSDWNGETIDETMKKVGATQPATGK